MLGFESQIFGVGSNRSTHWATTTAQGQLPNLCDDVFGFGGNTYNLF